MSFSFSNIIISTISIIKRCGTKELLILISFNSTHFHMELLLLMTPVFIKTLLAGLGEYDDLIWSFDTVLHPATGSPQGPLKHEGENLNIHVSLAA